MAIAFVAALRGQDVRCRLVRDLSRDLHTVDSEPHGKTAEREILSWWAEVWCCDTNRWISVDPSGLREVDLNHEHATEVIDWNPRCTHVIAGDCHDSIIIFCPDRLNAFTSLKACSAKADSLFK